MWAQDPSQAGSWGVTSLQTHKAVPTCAALPSPQEGPLVLVGSLSMNTLPRRGCEATLGCGYTLPPAEAPPHTSSAVPGSWKVRELVPPPPSGKKGGSDRCLLMGSEDDYEGLSAAVCRHATSFYSHNTLPCSGRVISCPALCQSELYSRYFLVPKREGDRDPPDPGFTCSEQISHEIQTQDASTCVSVTSCTTECPVHLRRCKRCVFSHSHLFSPQKVPTVYFLGTVCSSLACL